MTPPSRDASARQAPPSPKASASDLEALLQLFMLDKALYELGYELNNRPDWVPIPLAGLLKATQTPYPVSS